MNDLLTEQKKTQQMKYTYQFIHEHIFGVKVSGVDYCDEVETFIQSSGITLIEIEDEIEQQINDKQRRMIQETF